MKQNASWSAWTFRRIQPRIVIIISLSQSTATRHYGLSTASPKRTHENCQRPSPRKTNLQWTPPAHDLLHRPQLVHVVQPSPCWVMFSSGCGSAIRAGATEHIWPKNGFNGNFISKKKKLAEVSSAEEILGNINDAQGWMLCLQPLQ